MLENNFKKMELHNSDHSNMVTTLLHVLSIHGTNLVIYLTYFLVYFMGLFTSDALKDISIFVSIVLGILLIMKTILEIRNIVKGNKSDKK